MNDEKQKLIVHEDEMGDIYQLQCWSGKSFIQCIETMRETEHCQMASLSILNSL